MTTAIAWPTQVLPAAPLWAGYRIEADLGLARTPMDSGLARQRRRFVNALSKVNVQWSMSGAQLQFFKSWLANKAGYGGAFFSILLPLDDGTRMVEARFTQAPTYVKQATTAWLVTSVLEVRDDPVMSGDVIDIILDIGVDPLNAMAANLAGVTLAPAFDAWHTGFGA